MFAYKQYYPFRSVGEINLDRFAMYIIDVSFRTELFDINASFNPSSHVRIRYCGRGGAYGPSRQ